MSVWRYIHVSKSVHRDQERDGERERKREHSDITNAQEFNQNPVNATKKSGKCSEEFVVSGESHQILKKKGHFKAFVPPSAGISFLCFIFLKGV